MIDCEGLASFLFELDSNIRYVGIIDERHDKVLLSRLRTGIVPLTLEHSQLLELYPVVIMRAAERAQATLGALKTAVFRYEKSVLVARKLGDLVVVIGLEPRVEPPSYVKRIDEVLSKYNVDN